MRKLRSKYTKEMTNWYCEKCKQLIQTQLRFVRHRCEVPGCGRFMNTVSESELVELLLALREERLAQYPKHNTQESE